MPIKQSFYPGAYVLVTRESKPLPFVFCGELYFVGFGIRRGDDFLGRQIRIGLNFARLRPCGDQPCSEAASKRSEKQYAGAVSEISRAM